MTRQAWAGIVELIERAAADPDLVTLVVTQARSTSPEIAALDVADVARHTRAMLAAATRAIAARRGPSEAELSFVEDLAVTRAGQGVPVHAVLSAIHVGERQIWAHAKDQAAEMGLDAALVLDARELYDDWAQAVRERLIVAHRSAEEAQVGGGPVREEQVLRRLLQGGTTAALAASEVGLGGGDLIVLVAPLGGAGGASSSGATERALYTALRRNPNAITGRDGRNIVSVARVGTSPTPRAGDVEPERLVIGIAGPGGVEALPRLRRLAERTAHAARVRGRHGPVHVGEVAALVALLDRPDLGDLLTDRYQRSLDSLGRQAATITGTVLTWVEQARDADRSAAELFVHPNTVRNRVAAFTRATGLDLEDPFGALDAWWLCHTWLNQHAP